MSKKQIWAVDAFGFPKKLEGYVYKDGGVWKVDALGFPSKYVGKIYDDGTVW